MVSSNTVRQTDSCSNRAVAETVTGPTAAKPELGQFSTTCDKLGDEQADDLDGFLNSIDNIT